MGPGTSELVVGLQKFGLENCCVPATLISPQISFTAQTKNPPSGITSLSSSSSGSLIFGKSSIFFLGISLGFFFLGIGGFFFLGMSVLGSTYWGQSFG